MLCEFSLFHNPNISTRILVKREVKIKMEENKPKVEKKPNLLEIAKVMPLIFKYGSKYWGNICEAYALLKPIFIDIAEEMRKKEEEVKKQ